MLLAAEQIGISMKAITDRLLEEGLQLFRDAFDQLLVVVESHSRKTRVFDSMTVFYRLSWLPGFRRPLKGMGRYSPVRRLWNRDPSLWTNEGEHRWLGWLDITDQQLAQVPCSSTWRKKSGTEGSCTFSCWEWVDRACAGSPEADVWKAKWVSGIPCARFNRSGPDSVY